MILLLVGREVSVFGEIDVLQQLFEAFASFLAAGHLRPEIIEKRALRAQYGDRSERTVSWHDGLYLPAREIVEHLYPVPGISIAIADVVARPPVDVEIASEQDAVFRQERDRITNRVRRPDAPSATTFQSPVPT